MRLLFVTVMHLSLPLSLMHLNKGFGKNILPPNLDCELLDSKLTESEPLRYNFAPLTEQPAPYGWDLQSSLNKGSILNA